MLPLLFLSRVINFSSAVLSRRCWPNFSLVAVRGLLIETGAQASGVRASVAGAHGPSCSAACGMRHLPRPGIKPVAPETGGRILNHWTTGEVPQRGISVSSWLWSSFPFILTPPLPVLLARHPLWFWKIVYHSWLSASGHNDSSVEQERNNGFSLTSTLARSERTVFSALLIASHPWL